MKFSVLSARVRDGGGAGGLMCDALSRNIPSELKTIVCHCLFYARRQFVEIIENFPEECAYMIEHLAIGYRHEAFTRLNTGRNSPGFAMCLGPPWTTTSVKGR